MRTSWSISVAASQASLLEIFLCRRKTSATWRPMRWTGLSADIGSWKITPISPPRICRICASLACTRSRPLNKTLAAENLARRLRQQPHDRHRGDALAAAGLADDADGFPFGHREGNLIDGAQQAAVGLERRDELVHFEDVFGDAGHGWRGRPRASAAGGRARRLGGSHPRFWWIPGRPCRCGGRPGFPP